MPSIELTDDQVIELIRRMPPERRRAALLALAEGARARQEARQGMLNRNCDGCPPSEVKIGTP
jgi:hypothetical protein